MTTYADPKRPLRAEVTSHAKLTDILYGQCWEDADVLMNGLDVQPGDTCLSVASAGDNTLALLSSNPRRVIAVDVSVAQLACLDLRVAAFRVLTYEEILELMGARPSTRRPRLYRACRNRLDGNSVSFWDERISLLDRGLVSTGRLEKYLTHFRRRILPLIHNKDTIRLLFTPMSEPERAAFFDAEWDTRRWRALVRLFFSQQVMSHLGREASFFRYVNEPIAEQILRNTRHAFVKLDPSQNPYLQWILTGQFGRRLPFALREENVQSIFQNLDALEWRQQSVESFLQRHPDDSIDRFNLSDIFEYVSESSYHSTLRALVRVARPEARVIYWNLLVPRHSAPGLAQQLVPLTTLSRSLHKKDQAFFYRDVVIEKIVKVQQ